MSDPDLLDPDLRSLFDDVKMRDAIDPSFDDLAEERMLRRVEQVVHHTSNPPPSVFSRRGVILISVGLIAMFATSRFVNERQGAATVPVVPSVAPVPSPPLAVLPTLSVDELPSSTTPPPSTPPPVRVRTPSAPTASGGLAEEYLLVEGARAKLAAKDYAGAIQSIRAHDVRFPRGQLNQECESLYIQLLVETGRIDEARERERSFRARFPNGLLLPSVAHAIATGPGATPR